ncbi:hypothetical protein [Shewanella japonica]|uniref:hypothetical protein n=1 Tax=Shewanella japonica TaxID=93973 RepID=UPI0024958822|nr:hypothetical protein [Shewanella japonica]
MKLSISSIFCLTLFSPLAFSANYSAPDNYNGIIKSIDINNDGVEDFVVYDVFKDSPEFEVYSGVDGSLLTYFYFPNNFLEPSFHWVSDRNNDGFKDVGLFGVNPNSNKFQFILKSSKTGEDIKTWTWNKSLSSADFYEIDDISGDDRSDFGIFGTHSSNGTKQLQVRDGVNRSPVTTFKWPNNWLNPKVVSMSDVTGDGISEIALYGQHKRRENGQLFVLDGVESSTKLDVYNWVKNWDDINLYALDDIDGDGTFDWGQFGRRFDDGRYQMVIKRGDTKYGTLRTLIWNTKIATKEPLILDDITGDGIQEVAVAGFDIQDGKFKALINDGRLPNTRIKNVSWPSKWGMPSKIIELHDVDGDGINDLGLLGEVVETGSIVLSIKSSVTGRQLSSYEWDDQWFNFHLTTLDVNDDGILDFALAGNRAITMEKRLSIRDGVDPSLDYFDKILAPYLVTLDSFLTARLDSDFRYLVAFNDFERARSAVNKLLFDGDNLHLGNKITPYNIENSYLKVSYDDGEETSNFLYVSRDFGISLLEEELFLYSRLSPESSTNVNSWNSLEVTNKLLHFLFDGGEGEGAEPESFTVTFFENNQAFIGGDVNEMVPWTINQLGQLIIETSVFGGEQGLILNKLASDEKVIVATDNSNNLKPILISEDLTIILTIENSWTNPY